MSQVLVVPCEVSAAADGIVLAVIGEGAHSVYVEFDDATQVAPSDAELPCMGGERAEWFSIECDDGEVVNLLRREPDGFYASDPLPPERVAEIWALVDEMLADDEGGAA